MLKNISKREKIILAVCLLLLLVYFIFNFVFVPINRKINDLSSEIAVKELELKKSYKILRLKQGQDEEFKKYSDTIKQKESDEQEMSALLSEIESVSSKMNIHLSDMKPLRVRAVEFYKKFSVELEAEGLLDDLTRFIYTLQDNPYLLDVERIRLERRSMRTDKLKAFMLINRIRIP